MKHSVLKLALPVVLCCAALTGGSAVRAAQIVVGQVAPLSGPESAQGRAYAVGMQLLFDSVNQSGGVNGHTFTLASRDDGGRSHATVRATQQLLTDSMPLVLAGYVGQQGIAALTGSGLLEKEKITLVGYRAAVTSEQSPWLYNVRASLRDELAKITEHLSTLGVMRLGLLYEESPGKDAIIAAAQDLAGKGLASIVAFASYEAGTTRVSDAVDGLIKAAPQAVILVSSGAASARFIEQYRAGGGTAQIFVHSGADMELTARLIARDRLSFVSTVMRGVAIAQVVPNPYEVAPLPTELQATIAKSGKQDVPVGYVVMEGFIAAKVIVEAVRRQGARPTRTGMAVALNSIENLNLGGYVVGFRQGSKTGSRFVELSIISDTGKIRQ